MALQDEIESMPVTSRSGSAGAVVASRNQYGPYYRDRTTPTDPQSALQLRWRSAMTGRVKDWKKLSNTQREAWYLYAARVARSRPESRFPRINGYGHFIRSNVIRSANGLDTVDDPPIDTSTPRLIVGTIEHFGVPVQLRLFIDNTLPWANTEGSALIVSASPEIPSTVNFHRSPMRTAGTVLGHVGPFPASTVFVRWPFGPGPLTQYVMVSLRVSLADGRLSEPLWKRTTLAD